jgi:hypothetical protein
MKMLKLISMAALLPCVVFAYGPEDVVMYNWFSRNYLDIQHVQLDPIVPKRVVIHVSPDSLGSIHLYCTPANVRQLVKPGQEFVCGDMPLSAHVSWAAVSEVRASGSIEIKPASFGK